MKLSRLTLALALAATIGLSVPSRQAQCLAGSNNPGRSAEESGSPSYQAAQNYDDFDCFASGCHRGYGDVLPDLNSDETDVREQGLPPEPTNVDADLPGDSPTQREIPSTTMAPQSPAPNYGFADGEQAPEGVPARGYFSPGYPHPGYQHPSYGYSHTEVEDAWFLSPSTAESNASLTEDIVTSEAAAEEALVEEAVTYSEYPQEFSSASADAALAESLAEEGFETQQWLSDAFDQTFDAELWMADAEAEEGFSAEWWMLNALAELDFNAELWMLEAQADAGFSSEVWMLEAATELAFNAELWMLEALAELNFDARLWMLEAEAEEGFNAYLWMANVEDEQNFDAERWMADAAAEESLAEEQVSHSTTDDLSQEYTRYDDTYGYQSEWYAPYDATKVLPPPTADMEELVDSAPGLPADHTISGHSQTESVAEVDPAPASEAELPAMVDYGPAELEVDTPAATANSDDEEDAALEAAIRAEHDDWFYRETYGYGPRYDYDTYGYEDFLTNAPTASTLATERSLVLSAAISTASGSLPWDYVYRLELGDLLEEASQTAASIQIPFARNHSNVSASADDSEEMFLMAEAYGLEQPSPAQADPAVPAGTDFDPAAILSAARQLFGNWESGKLLKDAAWLSRTLTPMELARLALQAVPVQSRGEITILIPQPQVIGIAADEPVMEGEDALRELAMLLNDAGRALQMLSRSVEAYADATSPFHAVGPTAPLQTRNPGDLETR